MIAIEKHVRDSRHMVTFYAVEGGYNNCTINTNCDCNCGGGGGSDETFNAYLAIGASVVGCTFVAADSDPSTPHETNG